MPLRCSDGVVQEIYEPEWIQRLPGGARILLDTTLAAIEPVSVVRAVWRTASDHGVVELTRSDTANEWILPSIPERAEVLLELDGHWIWRWLP